MSQYRQHRGGSSRIKYYFPLSEYRTVKVNEVKKIVLTDEQERIIAIKAQKMAKATVHIMKTNLSSEEKQRLIAGEALRLSNVEVLL